MITLLPGTSKGQVSQSTWCGTDMASLVMSVPTSFYPLRAMDENRALLVPASVLSYNDLLFPFFSKEKIIRSQGLDFPASSFARC